MGLARAAYRSAPPADNSDVFFITGTTDNLSRALKHTKPSGGEERLLIGRSQVEKSKFQKYLRTSPSSQTEKVCKYGNSDVGTCLKGAACLCSSSWRRQRFLFHAEATDDLALHV